DPTRGHGADDVASGTDTDKDGLSDDEERKIGTNPNDADSDDDGVIDGKEPNPAVDSDGDGLINALDPDSDDDALFDGTEVGRDCSAEGTAADGGHCITDADLGATTTSPLLRDTDAGGVRDGAEDSNVNGRQDDGETDPALGHGEDDGDIGDADGDGLSDALEEHAGSAPDDSDSDDDGLLDGDEPNPLDDADGDGAINLRDPDSDADELFDGTERGKGCDDSATDREQDHCRPDADGGETTTGAVTVDTDDGGVNDGVEDGNHDGRIDPAELDPNDPRDDVIGQACSADADCGSQRSGLVCDAGECRFGCRGRNGNGCPSSLFCSSLTDQVGTCGDSEPEPRDSDAGTDETGTTTSPAEAEPLGPPGRLEGGGIDCHVAAPGAAARPSAGWLVAGLGVWMLRRRRRSKRHRL
ncbi:MAG: MYXO-CTERM sorting domain-containing protein, partial [Polyangiales bacterium]